MKKYLFLGIVLLLTAGCQAGKKTGNFPVTILLDWVPNTNHTGLYTAKALGYFDEVGLDVSIEQPPEGGDLDLLMAGKAQFAITSQDNLVRARTNGLNIKAVAAILQHNDSVFASLAEKNITRPRDFAGKTYVGWGGAVETKIIETMMKNDGAANTGFKMESAGGIADLRVLQSGAADFIWIFRGWDGLAAEREGIHLNLIKMGEYDSALDFYTPLIVSTDAFINHYPQQARAFMQAVARGYEYASYQPQEAAGYLIDAAPGLNRRLVEASQRYLASLYLNDKGNFGIMKEEVFKRYNEWLDDNGINTNPPAANELFTNALLQ